MAARAGRILALTAAFGVLAYYYLRPASDYLLGGRSDVMLGDGSDMTALPFMYGILIDTLKQHWNHLFYGAVHTYQLDPPDGFLLWFTWIEKALVPLLYRFFTVEQLATPVAWVLFVANGLAFYAFGRFFKWPRVVCFALGIAWAFNAFTRARASVHLAMAGTFFLPLTLIGVTLVFRHSTGKQKGVAAALFVIAAMSHPYFVASLAFLSPLIVLFGFLGGQKKRWGDFKSADLLVVLAPVVFLAAGILKPAPEYLMKAGVTPVPPAFAVEMFMETFGARPIDYLGFDPKHGTKDWNPLRASVNESISRSIGQGNEHERSNGIRWSLILLALWALFETVRRRPWAVLDRREKFQIWTLAGIGVLSFWTSLPPSSSEIFGYRLSPFVLINAVFGQFRVPSRFSICVQFAVIAICGFYLSRLYAKYRSRLERTAWKRTSLWLFLPAIMILDYPPMLPIRTYPVLSALAAQETGPSGCGTGLFFPYFSGISVEITRYYHGLQMLRNTDCRTINLPNHDARNGILLDSFSPPPYFHAISDPVGAAKYGRDLAGFAKCSGLDWIYFRLEVQDSPWISQVCEAAGLRRVTRRFCRRDANLNQFRWDQACFPKPRA